MKSSLFGQRVVLVLSDVTLKSSCTVIQCNKFFLNILNSLAQSSLIKLNLIILLTDFASVIKTVVGTSVLYAVGFILRVQAQSFYFSCDSKSVKLENISPTSFRLSKGRSTIMRGWAKGLHLTLVEFSTGLSHSTEHTNIDRTLDQSKQVKSWNTIKQQTHFYYRFHKELSLI